MFQVKHGLNGQTYCTTPDEQTAREMARGLSLRSNQSLEIRRETSAGWSQLIAYAYHGRVSQA